MALEVPCEACGARLSYAPGSLSLTCPYCEHRTPITDAQQARAAQVEIDLYSYMRDLEQSTDQLERRVIACPGCGAETGFDAHVQASRCPFCDTPLVLEQAKTVRQIKPRGLLPFQITRTQARANFAGWLKKLWFAPNKLYRQTTRHDAFEGVYLPFWTYDCQTFSNYTGERGEHYFVTVSGRDAQGRETTRREQRTRWYPASGRVSVFFDDLLVAASDSLPQNKLDALQPWDLNSLVDYKDEYLSGFKSETYQISLEQGYTSAQKVMANRINEKVKQDIGGDTQRVHSVNTTYTAATFKHILLPVWVSAYRFQAKLYQVLVNARSGEVQAERPWSWVKIGLAISAMLLAAVIAAYIHSRYSAAS